jgi:hypothetical protein
VPVFFLSQNNNDEKSFTSKTVWQLNQAVFFCSFSQMRLIWERSIFTKTLTMKKAFTVFAGLFLFFAAQAQKEISIDSLSQHVGDSVTVCTKIYGGIFLDRSKDSLTLLNAGGRYPNSPLTVMIRISARRQFKEPPEVFYKDKDVCITGKIILYKEKPEIVVYDEKQIVVR